MDCHMPISTTPHSSFRIHLGNLKMAIQQRVLVTAAARGIGRAMVEGFLARGDRVHICDVDEAALAKFRAAHPEVGATLADVSDPAQVDRLFDAVEQNLGGLDVLIANAGIAGPTAVVEDVEIDAWQRTIDINLNGAFYCVRRAVPLIKAAGGGSIVIISSAAGLFGYPLRSPYAASKWALIGFTKTLAMELGGYGIRVNAICPGPVAGPRIDGVIDAKARAHGVPFDKMREVYLNTLSLHTFIDGEDIANMALFLTSSVGAKISGQALAIDGHTETLRT
jgi:NAD(P)-dependent dehydrogenase (short-subunit alcohol dehydrogenase family)